MGVAAISATLFGFFDAHPVIGRFFTAEEITVPLGALVAVLSHGFWQTRYGSAPNVLGKSLRIGTASYTIIGVASKGLEGIADEAPPVAFIPITAYTGILRAGPKVSSYYTRYTWGGMQVLARRKPGISLAAASADLSRAYRQSYDYERTLSPGLTPPEVSHPAAVAGPVQAERGPRQSTVTKVASWVSGVALMVLLIACANVANLMLARSVSRRREIALRLALGVSRPRLLRQLLTENLLLAGRAAIVGLLFAHWSDAALRLLFLPSVPGTGALATTRTIGFTLLLAVLAGGLTGLAPLFQARRTDLVESLKSGTRDGGYRRSRGQSTLLLFQAALSVVLLVGAGLFVRSLDNVGTRTLRGRGITAEDRAEAPRVTVLSESMAATLWPGQEALGRCLRIGADSMPCTCVVGVTEDIRQNSLTDGRDLNYYMPIAQFHPEGAVVFARVRGQAEERKGLVRRALQPLVPGDGYVTVTPMREIVGPRFVSWELGATIFLAFGGLALVLAAIGLYAGIAYDVLQRAHELEVRIALGARVGDVVRLVVGDGLRIALLSVAIGGIIALWAGRWIVPLLYEQSPHDPLIFGVVTGGLFGVALLASAIPALRAQPGQS